ncbi:hypothetical protein A6R71_09870 [Xanthomonas translucens pv. arrhenatheri]|nr:ATP-binding protein [Xanthomonas translucens]OAX65036.1 hypothetical protein A6R71_09870 [Xanthomonas translucens pv. arrhenatheri]UKE78239.1 ATP-binding protein [Xanthomonas translucens pv. arrhenatheri]
MAQRADDQQHDPPANPGVRPMSGPSPTAGGRATEAGMSFQASVAAWFAAHLVSDMPVGEKVGMAGDTRLVELQCETADPMDDVVARLANGGKIYVQCKTQAGLARAHDSALGRTISQLVDLYLDVAQAVGTAQIVAVLAVQESAPRSLDNLEGACRMFDAGGTWPAVLALLSAAQREALALFEDHVRVAWEKRKPVGPSDDDLVAMARLFRIARFSEPGEGAEWRLASHLLGGRLYGSADKGEQPMLALLDISRRAIRSGAPQDRKGLLRSLRSAGHLEVAAPGFDEDIATVLAYSTHERERLKKHTVLPLDGIAPLERDCLKPLLDAARDGSLLVTGEPGAGKTGVLLRLADLAEQKSGPVLFLSVERFSGFTHRRNFRDELGIVRDLLDVLAAWPGDTPGLLIIDALDASRGGPSEQVLATFIADAVAKIGERWSIVASIRSFDLRNGQRFRDLMRGSPPDHRFMEKELADVRHFHVARLSARELAAIAAGSPELKDLESTAPYKVKELLRNIFNLSLAAELLASGVEAEAIGHLATQSELISRYEDVRLTGHRMQRAAKATVTQMIQRRRLIVPSTAIEHDAVDDVRASGVLVSAGRDQVAFAHHVLFDHIAGRFYLDASDPEALRGQLPSDAAMGLLLGPALRFALERLWKEGGASHDSTWLFLLNLASEDKADPVLLSTALRTAAEQVEVPSDIDGLLLALKASEHPKAPGKLLGQLSRFVGMTTGQVAPDEAAARAALAWMRVARFAAASTDGQAVDAARMLLMAYFDRIELNDASVLAEFGEAARTLLSAAWSTSVTPPAMASAAIRFVTRSYGADCAASRALLERILEDRFEQHASNEAPWLADGVRSIYPHDPDFVVHIYGTLFERDVTDQSKTWMGGTASRILPLTSTHRQDYQHARWQLGQSLPPFLNDHPAAATRAVISAVRGLNLERRSGHDQTPPAVTDVDVDGRLVKVIDDYLTLQDWRARKSYDAEVLTSFVSFLKDCSDAAFRTVVEAALQEATNAAVWSRILGTAADRGPVADNLLAPLVLQPRFLEMSGVTRDAIMFLVAVYPRLAQEQRRALEEYFLQDRFLDDERQARLLSRLLSDVPAEQLATKAMRAQRATFDMAGRLMGNRPAMEMSFGWAPTDDIVDSMLQHSGANLEQSPDREIRAASRLVEDAVKGLPEDADASTLVILWEHAASLSRLLDAAATPPPHPQLAHSSWGALSNAVEKLAASKAYEPGTSGLPELNELIDLIDRLSTSPYPESANDTSKGMGWGNWDVRVYAAESITSLAPRFALDRPDLLDRMERCLDDPAPTVRHQVSAHLNVLWDVAPDRMWHLVDKVVEHETHRATLAFFVSGPLWPMARKYPGRTAQILSRLLSKNWPTIEAVPPEGRDEFIDAAADLIAFLYVARGSDVAWQWIERWVTDLQRGAMFLTAMLHGLREVFFFAYRPAPSAEDLQMVQRLQRLIHDAAKSAAAGHDAARPHLLGTSTDEAERWRPLFDAADKVLDQICNQLYFGAGAFNPGNRGEKEQQGLPSPESKQRFIVDCAPILDILDHYSQARTIYNLVGLYGFLAEGDPGAIFDRVAKLLLGAGAQDGYHYEHLGSESLVKLVRRYLADHRDIFDDGQRRAKLIEILELFSGAGWPEALRLMFELPDLLR